MRSSLSLLMNALDPRTIAREVASIHDDARASYVMRQIKVQNFREFLDALADYANHHHRYVGGTSGATNIPQAAGRARAIIENAYRRRNQSIKAAYRNALEGTEGGLRAILDTLCEHYRDEAVSAYTREMLDLHVSPVEPRAQERIVRELFEMLQPFAGPLQPDIDLGDPRYYASSYESLVRAVMDNVRRIADSV